MLATVTMHPDVAAPPPEGWRRLLVGCRFLHDMPAPTHAVLQVEPHPESGCRIVGETWDIPGGTISVYSDIYANRCRRVTLPEGPSVLRYDAVVDAPAGVDDVAEGVGFTPAAELPAETLLYTLPSRFCPSDSMGALAFQLFGSATPGWEQIVAISEWVNSNIRFRYGSSTPHTSADQVYAACEGVCRDMTHLTVTFCRALGFPTRYVFGYMPDIGVPPDGAPMDFCAWAEIYLGGRWYTIDARNHGRRRTGRVVIGRGRDALDVAMLTAFGTAPLQNMVVIAEPFAVETLVPSAAQTGGN
jgi:transglutaminase-like putative cysteine protease